MSRTEVAYKGVAYKKNHAINENVIRFGQRFTVARPGTCSQYINPFGAVGRFRDIRFSLVQDLTFLMRILTIDFT